MQAKRSYIFPERAHPVGDKGPQVVVNDLQREARSSGVKTRRGTIIDGVRRHGSDMVHDMDQGFASNLSPVTSSTMDVG